MERFGMKGGDQRDMQIAKRVLPVFLDRSIEDCCSEPELKLEPLPERVEIDGVTPHRHYHYDDDCCEGMRW
jgi:hypothetical protein